jgi:hypothetical protein
VIEQQLAERFRAVVGDEPPLGFDPDEFVDRLFRRRRRRQAIGTALAVVVVATAAVAGVTTLGEPAPPGYGAAAVATPSASVSIDATPPPAADLELTDEYVGAVSRVLPAGKFSLFRVPGTSRADRLLYYVGVKTNGLAQGVVQVRVDDVVEVEVDLSVADRENVPLAVPVEVPAGAELTVALSCVKSPATDKVCQAGVTFQFGVLDR